ncbi:MAG TPA: bifunctional proline dehydrogenase/L-glutamate gamma-semialdehyde dehydrogenase, partial [Rhizobiales bacterium]|nr:bifunctional proline dehydrogenase/L-glutamate gamma-semialdehyde dehydrogenase [Hyphomicrobiales bacterium]
MAGFAPRAIRSNPFPNEAQTIKPLAKMAALSGPESKEVERRARGLVKSVRAGRKQAGGIEEFMQEYELSSQEGLVLMCLAEALLRIPDAKTADKLIADKIGGAEWQKHIGNSQSLFVNASTWGLMLTGTLLDPDNAARSDSVSYLTRLVSKAGEPVIRQAMRHAMRIMGKQFVLGRNIDEAMKIAKPLRETGYRFSFDMLGEAARSMKDAEKYFDAYRHALDHIAEASRDTSDETVFARPSISIKLSAIHPRYEE